MRSRAITRIIVYLLVYLGVPALGILLEHETISPVIAILYILVLIPIGILQMIDFYRTNDGTTVFGRAFNILFRIPLALLGLVCLVAGIGIIGWVLYNVFVERQKEYSGPSFISGLGSFGVSVPLVIFGWYTLRSVVRRKEKVAPSPKEQEEYEHEEDDEEHAA